MAYVRLCSFLDHPVRWRARADLSSAQRVVWVDVVKAGELSRFEHLSALVHPGRSSVRHLVVVRPQIDVVKAGELSRFEHLSALHPRPRSVGYLVVVRPQVHDARRQVEQRPDHQRIAVRHEVALHVDSRTKHDRGRVSALQAIRTFPLICIHRLATISQQEALLQQTNRATPLDSKSCQLVHDCMNTLYNKSKYWSYCITADGRVVNGHDESNVAYVVNKLDCHFGAKFLSCSAVDSHTLCSDDTHRL